MRTYRARGIAVDAQRERSRGPWTNVPRRSMELLLQNLRLRQSELATQNEALRRSQAVLKESCDRYRHLYEFAPVGYLTLTDVGRIAEINLAAAMILKEDRGRLLHSRFTYFVAFRDQERWQNHLLHAFQHGGKRSCELSLQCVDGSFCDAHLDLQLTASDDKEVVLQVVLTDITARKRAEDELRKLSLAVAQSPVSIVITDRAGCIEYVNPAFTLVSGYSAAEAIGQNPRVLKSSRTPPETYVELWATLVAGNVWRGEFINRRKDGTDYYEAASISPLRQPDGRLTHYVAVKEDITELRYAMAELRVSEDRLRLAKTAAGLGVFDWDLTSGKGDWDALMRELHGIGPDEPITYASFMADVHPDDRASTQATIDEALVPGGSGEYHAEYRVIRRCDSSVRHVASNGQVFFDGDHAVRFIGTCKDISAQKQLELEIQGRRVEMQLLIKQQVAAHTAAAIAHELNQPLVSISAYSEAALRMLREGNKRPEKLVHALEGAMEQAQRAGRTLHELLDFLHWGDAAAELLDVSDVVREALAMVMEGGYGRFRPLLELEPDLPPVLANRLQLQKILDNLLHNGIEAMTSGGVPMATIAITVRATPGRDRVQVTVRDSGPGLDPQVAERVFEPFFTTKSDGIGLGLAISRALVEAHGGQLWADPEGPGAAFHLTLPFAT